MASMQCAGLTHVITGLKGYPSRQPGISTHLPSLESRQLERFSDAWGYSSSHNSLLVIRSMKLLGGNSVRRHRDVILKTKPRKGLPAARQADY